MGFFNMQRQTHLQQYRCKDLSYSLVEGVDGRVQHGGHEEAVVKVVFCDYCGMQLEEHQHLLSAVPRCFNLTKEDETHKHKQCDAWMKLQALHI